MSTFRSQLDNRNPSHDPDERTWVFVPYDQLTDRVGPLAERPADELGIVMVETSWKGNRRPYHRQKLAFVLANQRHFALEQADRGVAVTYLTGDRRYADMLRDFADDHGPLVTMRPAERELRADLAELVDDDLLNCRAHEGWLTEPEDFRASQDGTPWRMDSFYQRIRQQTGILMEDGSPVGGKYSFDADNREFWSGDPPAPAPPTFDVDPVTAEVGELIRDEYDHHPGQLDLPRLPTTADDAERSWQWALAECMEHFGPFEDAMSRSSRTLFHTRISPLVNLHRLLPERVLEDVVDLDIPLNSKEGFVRQLIGWREFMHHVHSETDGFRRLPDDYEALDHPPAAYDPGTGGWEKWQDESWPTPDEADSAPETLDGGALPNHLDADGDVPPAFWGEPSGLNCLDTVVESVLDEGWSHHITRLMILSNIATMLGVEPRALTDWFWVAYIDAFDWVVEPNVLGMGTFGLGDLFVTKPYVSGSNYIDKMSDYCADCQFDPGEDCPLKPAYWAFLDEQEDALDDNPRMGLMLGMMRKRDDSTRESAQATLQRVRDLIDDGERVTPTALDAED